MVDVQPAKRSRAWMLELEVHPTELATGGDLYASQAYAVLKKSAGVNSFVSVINHDSDIDDDGNLKREHLHVVIRVPNGKTKSAMVGWVATQLGISANRITCSAVKSMDACIRYLTHIDDEDKHQYDWRDIMTTDYDLVAKAMMCPQDNQGVSEESLIEICISASKAEHPWEVLVKQLGIAYCRKNVLLLDKLLR